MNYSYRGYQDMVLENYVEKLRAVHKVRTAELASLKTREDALAYQAKVRKAVAVSFGPWPESCPLNPVSAGIIKEDGYIIEKVRFCSRPDFWVTANLYIPENLEGKAPAVVVPCGHATDGKAGYQFLGIRLVKNGFVVLIYDPVQQGDREQYTGIEKLGQAEGLCNAHNVMDKQLQLLGESFSTWRVWDGRRAIDYLLTRPEVDPERLGITGNSGGGTLTEWIWANDNRLAMAAPSCHVTEFLTNLENEMPTDAEQCPPNIIAQGLEMVDMMICKAPKPAMLLGQKYDFFERRGLKQAFKELKHFYSLLGAPGSTELFIGPATHGYSVHNQEAMVKFFCRIIGKKDVVLPEEVKTREGAELFVCQDGKVANAGSKPVFQIAAELADKAEKQRVAPAADEWNGVIADLLQLPEKPVEPPHYRCLPPHVMGDVAWSRYAVETEDNIKVIIRKRLADRREYASFNVEEEVSVYLPHFSSEADAASEDVLINLNPGGSVYALDLRGLGESMPQENANGPFHQAYGKDYMFHSFGLMMGQSYLGRRVYDTLRTLDLLLSEGTKTVHLYGRGQGAVIAAFAAKLHPAVASVTLYNAPASYREWIDGKVCDWPVANVPFGVLKKFDLPDLYAALGDRLKIISTWSNMMD